MKHKVLILLALLAAVSLHAQNASTTLNILSFEGYTPERNNKEFIAMVKNTLNIDLKINVTNIIDEKQLYDLVRSGNVDIFTPGMDLINDDRFDYIKKNLVAPLDLDKIPNYKNLIAAYNRPAYLSNEGKVYGTAMAAGGYWIAYRKSRFPTPPVSYDVFWKPEYKGRYVIGDYATHQAYLVALAMNVKSEDMFNYDKLFSIKDFREKFTYLHQNQKHTWNAVDLASDFAGADLGLAFGFGIQELWKTDKDWYMSVPKEGQLRWIDNIMISSLAAKDPVKLQLAHAYINYVLSADFQRKVIFEGAGIEPIVRNVLDSVNWNDFPGLVHMKNGPTKNRIEYLRPLTQRDRNGFIMEYNTALKK